MQGGGTFVLRLQEDTSQVYSPKKTGIQRCTCPDQGDHKCNGQGRSGEVLQKGQEQGF